MSAFARCLLLLFAGLLVLPPGWCCVLPAFGRESRGAKDAPECCRKHASAPSCCHTTAPEKRSGPASPAPSCSCCEPQDRLTQDNRIEVPAFDLALAPSLDLLAPASSAQLPALADPSPAPLLSARELHCLWLC